MHDMTSPHVRCGGEVGHGAGPGGGGVLILAEVEEGGKQYPEGPGGEACNDEGVLIEGVYRAYIGRIGGV